MDFNPSPSYVMHIDINSCFATIEQQANPFLRNKPIAVAAYTTDYGCILAASYEAKSLGVKTGMRVKEGKALCPNLIVLSPDPPKYRFVHLELRKLLNKYSYLVTPKSIDEFVVNFEGMPIIELKTMQEVALEIKSGIRREIGEAIRVSIGIAPNRFLAKTAASYKKPDGLFEINKDNYVEVFKSLKLTDLCGIKERNAARLAKVNIFSIMDFFNADSEKLKAGFRSITGYYWHLRLHGYEIDDIDFGRKSFGNSYALPHLVSEAKLPGLLPVMTKLIEKMSARLRKRHLKARGVHIGILFRDHSYWHKGKKLSYEIFAANDFYKEIYKLLLTCPNIKPVRNLAVSCFDLKDYKFTQIDLMQTVFKKESLVKALDTINNKYGNFTITSARMANQKDKVIDRIAFGGMSEI